MTGLNDEKNILKAYNMLLYFAGTMVMYDPAIECIHDFWKQGILKKLPVSSNNMMFIRAASQLRESVEDASSNLENMTKDFQQLFVSEDSPTVPVESSFCKKSTLASYRKGSDVTDFYRAYGFKSKFSPKTPADHIGNELLFLTKLIEDYLELDDNACIIEMRGEIRRLLNQHIFSWIPDWNKTVQEKASTVSYKGISSLIQACTEDIYSMMTGLTELASPSLGN